MLTNLLVSYLEALQSIPRREYETRLALLGKIRKLLEDGRGVREAFRVHGGSLMVVSVLAGLDEEEEQERGGQESTLVMEKKGSEAEKRWDMLEMVMSILATSWRGSEGELGRREFRNLVGAEGIEGGLKLSGFIGKEKTKLEMEIVEDSTGAEGPSPPSDAERLLSILYAFMVDDFKSPPVYTELRTTIYSTLHIDIAHHSPDSHSKLIATLLSTRPSSYPIERIKNGLIIPVILRIQESLPLEGENAERGLRFMVLESLRVLISVAEGGNGNGTNKTSLVAAAQEEQVLVGFLKRLEGIPGGEERNILLRLVRELGRMGMGGKVARELLDKVVKGKEGKRELDEEILELL